MQSEPPQQSSASSEPTGSRSSGSKSSGLRSDGTPRRPNPKQQRRRIPPPPSRGRGEEEWVREDRPVRAERDEVVDVGPKPEVDVAEFESLVTGRRAKTLAGRVAEAADHYAHERYVDARRLLRPIAEEVPGSATVRELYGLTQYCLGNWNEAARQLEALRELPNYNCDQHPVLMDCYRGLKRWSLVDELWAELRDTSPSRDLVIEGRIVVAGSLAERGQMAAAVRELEKGWKAPKKPSISDVRRAYALADLYERSGELPRARNLMGWVASVAPEFADAAERAESL